MYLERRIFFEAVFLIKEYNLTAEAAAAATLLLRFVPSTNLSLKAEASVKLSLTRSNPSVKYWLTCGVDKQNEIAT